jgi:hypothetical protein
LVAASWGFLNAQAIDACAPVAEGSLVESEKFAPFGSRRGGGIINEGKLPSSGGSIPANAKYQVPELGGRPHQVSVAGTGSVYSYFLDRPADGLTRNDFIRLGGIELHQDPMTAEGPFAAFLLSVAGERALAVPIGQYSGALTWADPDVNGLRTHNIYWSDGSNNFALITNQSAAAVVNLARSVAC